MTLSVRSSDLRRVLDVTGAGREAGHTGAAVWDVLEALGRLVPCDQITFQLHEPARRRFGTWVDLVPEETAPPFPDEFFWDAYWESPVCSQPQRTGDRASIARSSDFMSETEFRSSHIGEVFRLQHARYNALVPLCLDGYVDHRIELWRGPGRDFDDREILVLELLHPHLLAFDRAQCRAAAAHLLTTRQVELLALVTDGMTNRQIARRLSISEGTVRRHLENVYERLEVSNRASAAAYYLSNCAESARSSQSGGREDKTIFE